MPALLLGSISAVSDTSELQRQAFNDAFRQHGLDWQWDRDDYRDALRSNGGAARIADYAEQRGEQVDAAAVHETKSRLFQDSLASAGIAARPGITDTISDVKEKGWQVGLVTTTSAANVDALLAALAPDLTADGFDLVVTSSDVDDPKPDPAAYTFALQRLGVTPSDAVAVEDNVGGVAAATAAGVACIAFPNSNTATHDFGSATRQVDALDADTVTELVGS